MGETARPATGVKLPMTYREYGVILNPDEPDKVLNVGTVQPPSDAGFQIVWRAISQWQSLDTMG